jgi:uncharacterized protein HemX
MAAKGAERAKTEKNMIDQINGDEDAAPAETTVKAKAGWMTYVGSVLWLAVLLGVGGVGWLVVSAM